MRLSAYVMAGDPAWATESLASYYDLVDRVVVSLDADGMSWAGHPMPVQETVERLRRADPDGKIELLPGAWSDPSRFTLDLETEQRQEALDHAGKEADWVLQIDSDEIALSPARLREMIGAADRSGADALDFPSRHVYQRTRSGRLVERSTYTGRPRASYPGPLAVRAGSRLVHCRQAEGEHFRVDLSPRNTDPARGRHARVDEVIAAQDAVLHLSWVRSDAQMRAKSRISGHAEGPDWDAQLSRWRSTARHPYRAVLRGRLSRDDGFWLRLADDPVGPGTGEWLYV